MKKQKTLSESELSPRRLMARRFRRHRRGFWSLVILGVLYGLSLCAGWICEDPYAPLEVESFEPYRVAIVTVRPSVRVQRVQMAADGSVSWSEGHAFVKAGDRVDPSRLPEIIRDGLQKRFANEDAEAVTAPLADGASEIRLVAYTKRAQAPETVRLLFRDAQEEPVVVLKEGDSRLDGMDLPEGIFAKARQGYVEPFRVEWKGREAAGSVECPPVSWPFRPVPGHWLGTDMAGRDVFSRLLHGMRISMSFGMLLVAVSLFLGVLAGSVQGYFAGWTDLVAQRMTEIWSAVPFLYVMILLGNTFGRSFGLLLVCYAVFNWVGLAAYIRAEFLKLRTRPFVDAARMQGLGSFRIMMRHVLPNALTPVITLVPFELVGAIGSLAALDYLGFGLPDGTPSWGDLLHQAQLVHREAWWLIVYPSLALFVVMLLGVFVGEGMREAFDPRKGTNRR